MLWLLAHSAASACSSTLLTDPTGAPDHLVWPTYGKARTDSILVIGRDVDGAVGPLRVLDPSGSEVAATRYDLSDHLAVLVPDAPMAPGDGYRLDGIYGTFSVEEGTEDVGAPPVPVTRVTASNVRWEEEACPDEATTENSVRYRLCEPLALPLLVVGTDTTPGTPSLGSPGGLVYGRADELVLGGIEYGPGALSSATLWLGGFDGAGRFVGWTADPLVVPPLGTLREERAEGASGGTSTTPTAFASCPTSGVWVTEFERTCASFDPTTRDCNVAEASSSDASGDTGSGASGACGCAAQSGGGWLALVLVAPALRRRRRSS